MSRKTIERLGVRITSLGAAQTRDGIAWSAQVEFVGEPARTFRVQNDGNGGGERWSRVRTPAFQGHLAEGLEEAQSEIARLARREPALAEYADLMHDDEAAAGLWISAALDGAFLIDTVSR